MAVKKISNPDVKKNPTSSAFREAKNLPATYGALDKFRKELKSDIASLSQRMDSRFKALDSKFFGIDSQFKNIDSQFKNIDSQFKNIDSKFKNIDSKFARIDSKFKGIDSKFKGIDSKLTSMDSKLSSMDSKLNRMLALYEEQNSRNQASFEGAEFVKEKVVDLTKRVESLESFQHEISANLKRN